MVASKTASDALLERLLALHPRLIDLSLDRMWRLLSALDHPQDKCPPIIHIAGTNGKGSTAAMLRAILEADGKRVHAYHSPHLVRFHERIILSGAEIAEPLLEDVLARVEAANQGQPITFFEVTTAAAFLAFAEHRADYLILEVGLGGRLDATNVITPKCAAITSISMDHQDFLGDTLLSIAEEKAGILKTGVPAIIAKQQPQVMAFLTDYAARKGTPMRAATEIYEDPQEDKGIIYQSADGPIELPRPALSGAHQLDNAATALALAEKLQIGTKAMAIGLQTVNWPARLQHLKSGPLVDALSQTLPQMELRLDGGHNPAAGAALADWVATWLNAYLIKNTPTNDETPPVHIVLGMLASKAHEDYLACLAQIETKSRAKCAAHIHAVPIDDNDNALSADTLCAAAQNIGLNATAHENWRAALATIKDKNALIICAGSLYLAGHILAANQELTDFRQSSF